MHYVQTKFKKDQFDNWWNVSKVSLEHHQHFSTYTWEKNSVVPRYAVTIFDRSRSRSCGRTALAAESQPQVFCKNIFRVTRKLFKFAWGFFLEKITTKKFSSYFLV